MKSLFKTFGVLLLAAFLFFLLSNVLILAAYQNLIVEDIQDLPSTDVGLVLGTSRWTTHGGENEFFAGRVEAAAKLFQQGKIRHLILSGDNALVEYNEPLELLRALKDRGIEEVDMTLDYAGFRTLDSVVRSKEVFDQDSIVIISQSFHLPRALFIARKNGIRAYGFPASGGESSFLVRWREYLARPLSVVDVYLLRRRPKFLGEKEEIIIR